MTEKEILDELSISVACLLDDVEEINGQDIIKASKKHRAYSRFSH